MRVTQSVTAAQQTVLLRSQNRTAGVEEVFVLPSCCRTKMVQRKFSTQSNFLWFSRVATPWGLWEASIKISRKNDKDSPRCSGHVWSQGESELWKSDFLHHGRVWQETQAVGGKSYLLSLSSRRSFKKNLSSSSSSAAPPALLVHTRTNAFPTLFTSLCLVQGQSSLL